MLLMIVFLFPLHCNERTNERTTNYEPTTNFKRTTNEQTNEQTIISSLHTTINLFTTVAYPHITINMSTTVRSIDDAMMKKITDI